jgi:hypothetical protein
MVTSGTEIRPNAAAQVNAGFSQFRWIVRSDKPLNGGDLSEREAAKKIQLHNFRVTESKARRKALR